jgi:hypothetical protein
MAKTAPGDGDFRIDTRLPGPGGDVLLKTKRTSTAVHLRGVLLSLAYVLVEEPPSSRAVCVLADTRLTKERVREELKRFREIIGAELGSRVYAVTIEDGALRGELTAIDDSILRLIVDSAQRESANPANRVSQQTVKAAALTRWLTSKGRLGVADMQRATGASMPTVIAAFRAMRQDGLVFPLGSGWQLADELYWDSVRHMAEAHAAERRMIRFCDPSRHARTPEDMARRLDVLQSRGEYLDVDLGGVLGAEMHYPNLDITGAPRLDLCVYDGDASFVRKLDAGLLETSDPEDKAVLILHLTRSPQRDPRMPGHLRSASAVDCLADLLEIGLNAEARDFWRALTLKRKAFIEQRIQE